MTPKLIISSFGIIFFLAIYNIYARMTMIPKPMSNEKLESLKNDLMAHRYRILSLGGSSTWGTTLQHRTHSYPYILGSPQHKVTSDGFHATGLFMGSSYPSLCIENIAGRQRFDVILLEFSLGGHDGLDLLLKRLRLRYPRATIIYVHLYSLLTDVVDVDGHTPQELLEGKPDEEKIPDMSKDYHWGYGERISNAMYSDLKTLLKKYSGHMFSLPRPSDVTESLYLFSPDWHHLSQEGHNIVAEGIMTILKELNDMKSTSDADSDSNASPDLDKDDNWDSSFGTVDNRDQCSVWFSTGKIPFNYDGSITPSSFIAFGGTEEYALEVKGSGEGGTIYVDSSYSVSVPLFMFYMTKAEEYPFVEVATGIDHKDVKILDPIINSQRDVMKSEQVGWAEPGRNEVRIKPIMDSNLPFRVTGFALCEACLQLQQ